MNHNSFPSGEQSPSQSEGGDITEYPSFEEHMRALEASVPPKFEESYIPSSMKNSEIPRGGYLGKEDAEVHKKIQNGESLNIEDITSLARRHGFGQGYEGLGGFLEDIGLGDGSNFDVRLPGVVVKEDGSERDLPLSISFHNKEGNFTRVDIKRDQDGKPWVHSFKGEANEGADVGYNGPQDFPKDVGKFMASE